MEAKPRKVPASLHELRPRIKDVNATITPEILLNILVILHINPGRVNVVSKCGVLFVR